MKIAMTLNAKSVKKSIVTLKNAKKQLENEMLTEFLLTCCTFVYDKANEYIINSDIGENVKKNIISKWQAPEIIGNRAILRNTDSQAVFVEFGVGQVGQWLPHDRAEKANYEYNIPTQYKTDSGQWVFSIDDYENIDLANGYYTTKPNNFGEMWVMTKGSPAVMYAYNAIVDLELYGLKKIWQEIKNKYWG